MPFVWGYAIGLPDVRVTFTDGSELRSSSDWAPGRGSRHRRWPIVVLDEVHCGSADELLNRLEPRATSPLTRAKRWIYRGQGNADWDLIPLGSIGQSHTSPVCGTTLPCVSRANGSRAPRERSRDSRSGQGLSLRGANCT
jgi:hypothetical protein